MNDPQRGRNNSDGGNSEGPRSPRRPGATEGPPDLDELWRDFNQRLSRLFGGGGEGAGGGPPHRDTRQAGIGVVVVLAAVIFIWMCTGIYTVQEGQVGVVSTFGRYDTTTQPGLRWRAPWPIQAHEIVDVFTQRKVDVGMRGGQDRLKEALMLTDDENIVDMQFEVQYRVKDAPDGPRDYVYGSRFTRDTRDGDPSHVVGQVAESAMREVVGRRTMDEVLFGSRQQIADEVRMAMQTMLDRYNTGLLISVVAIQNAQPPDQVQAAFDDASKAVQDKERQINEGQAYANDVVPRARGNAARLTQEAEGYRVKVVETAEGDAARFRQVLTEYAKAPGVTRERMYLETMQQIFSSTNKLLIDTHNSSQLLYLPLDRLMQQGASAESPSHTAAPTPAAPGSSGAAESAAPADRGHDGSRSREREGR
ncbi:MAG TPA: FtsH protease activity modulator HflK [Burkholderiaceae bacterium]|nr:FtsH protease activity modulator HflK [Burkholderiaceae bacterium]